MKTYWLRMSVWFLLCFLGAPSFLCAQGCSDAGFCSMGAMKPDQRFNRRVNIRIRSIEISQYIARTRFENIIYSTSLDVNIGLSDRTSLQFKLPYTFVTGEEGWSTQGLGDISLSLSHNIWQKETYQISATIGAKFPTNNSNLTFNDRPLPMYYQTSLGTYDLVLGAALLSKNWLLAIGFQHPFNQNRNEFTHAAWNNLPAAVKYPESLWVERGSDIMFRVERSFRFSRFRFNVGLLPIYRLQKDRVESPETGEHIKVDDSNGLALSLLFGMTYRFSVKSGIKFLFGDRLVERKVNPDGLSREQVFTIGYQYNF